MCEITIKFNTSITVKETIVRKPAQISEEIQWRVWGCQSALGMCGNYGTIRSFAEEP